MVTRSSNDQHATNKTNIEYYFMNISAMANDWLLEGKAITKGNINSSLRRGTYSQKNIDGFLKDVKVNGMTVAEAARRNAIPRGSRDYVYKVATR